VLTNIGGVRLSPVLNSLSSRPVHSRTATVFCSKSLEGRLEDFQAIQLFNPRLPAASVGRPNSVSASSMAEQNLSARSAF